MLDLFTPSHSWTKIPPGAINQPGNDYKLDIESGMNYARKMFTVTLGTSKTHSGPWSDVKSVSWDDLTAMFTIHVVGSKDGLCVVPAKFRGTRRLQDEVDEIGIAVLDFDCGHSLREIESELKTMGLAAIIHSTHSHMTTRTVVNRGDWDSYPKKATLDSEYLFLMDKKKYLSRVAVGAKIVAEGAEYVTFEHEPCPKFRVILPLSTPWKASNYDSQSAAKAAWKDRYTALAASLHLNHDTACSDLNRLFYLPRRPANGPAPETLVIEGADCDIWSLTSLDTANDFTGNDDPFLAYGIATSRKRGFVPDTDNELTMFADPCTGEFVDLTAWAAGHANKFEIVTALKARSPSLFTGRVGDSVKHHIKCANASAHTDPKADNATFITNASEATNGGFVYHCRHGHCTGVDRLVFLRQILAAGSLTVADLNDPRFLAGTPAAAANDGSNEPKRFKITATPFTWRDPSQIPPRCWVYGHHLIRKFVSLTVAPGATGKSSLVIADGIAMASNRDILTTSVYGGPLRVWIWNLEDPREEIERRVVATMIHHDITPADIGDRLFLDSGRDMGLCIAKADRGGFTVLEPVIDALVEELMARRIDVLIVDPFVSSHSIPENDNGAIDALAKAWGRVAERTNTAIELVHHVRKLAGTEANAESARGAVALVAAARSCRVINRMTKDEAERAGLDSNRGYFRVVDDKCNLAAEPANADWYHLESVALENGDYVGVVEPWEWPNALDDIRVADLVNVQKAVDGKGLRAAPQAKDWVGYTVAEVLGWDIDERSARTKVGSLLKTWFKSGALVLTEVSDAKYMKRPIVEVGTWARIGPITDLPPV